VHVVVNHLRLRDPLTEETVQAARDGVRLVVEGGGSRGQVLKVDDRHLILVLEFPSAEEADRVAREVGGPWMREHITPLLAGDTERHLGEVIASTDAG
jgi:hypothetical protein